MRWKEVLYDLLFLIVFMLTAALILSIVGCSESPSPAAPVSAGTGHRDKCETWLGWIDVYTTPNGEQYILDEDAQSFGISFRTTT